ncbi:hypothetical protein C1I63_06965 [Rathayibacter caricis DSM 15933]|uniref:Tetratricopeptide repeat protein n=1 Tax=Rathayibacter caricis DSM 15933 TaxID=1328867 RepID=A0A2T4USW0_9MICO|nr:DUF6584 family protein [Rathayibacter caricis]PTL72610.1 hypothetical protein C1I63_06965 [Rathayibacter caricis DSM 15933]
MNEADAIARATRLWVSGRRVEALELLKTRVRRAPDESEARRVLVAFYRELGAPDQAGRWSLALDGEATPLERDRAARLVAASRVSASDLPEFLALPTGHLPAAVVRLLPDIERYRDRFRLSAEERLHLALPAEDWRDAVALTGWFVSSAIFVLAVLVSWAGALLGTAMTDAARWASVASLACLAIACGFSGWSAARRRRRAVIGWILGAVVLAAAVARFVAIAIDGGGIIRFSWER